MTTKRVDEALRALTRWDQRFGVWCACQVAREVLRYVPAGELRPLRAVETAEAWVTGRATQDEAKRAAACAYEAASIYPADDVVTYACNACGYAAEAAQDHDAVDVLEAAAEHAAYTAYAAAYAADVAEYGHPEWDRVCSTKLVRLREVVSSACMSFPG